MAAGPPASRRRVAEAGENHRIGGEGCDLFFRVDLVGFRPGAMVDLAVGTLLEVARRQHGAYLTAACVAPGSGEIVGSLAGFQGLAELLRCMEVGHEYSATVQALSPTRCTVHVARR